MVRDKELFNEVLKRFEDQYGLNVKRPYGDGVLEINKGDTTIATFNTDGYNLLYNLKRLCDALEDELR